MNGGPSMEFNFEQMKTLVTEARRKFEELHQRLAQTVVEASSGGGMVTVKMNGNKEVLEVKLDPEVVRNDADMLPDLIRAAMNEAGRRVDQQVKSQLGGLPLPPGLL